MNVSYLGPLKDYSGYGEASRHHVAALDAAGVNVQAELVTYSTDASDFGEIGKTVDRLLENKGHSRIRLLHTTPDQFKRHLVKGKYHVGFCYWETDKLPEGFAAGLKHCDEVWTGSESNRQAILSTGVDKPVYIFPQPLETEREWPDPYQIPDFDGFLFYSIFEWTDRKNPGALLNAFWQEFQNDENVGLLLKTYHRNFVLSNKRMVRSYVQTFKNRSGLRKFPPVFLYLDLMDRHQVMRVHKTGHCFVSTHRGEGWGVPQAEAMLAGNPVISTGYGGIHEYVDDCAKLLPFEMVPVSGMLNSKWYQRTQNWADVKVEDVRKALRWAYDNNRQLRNMAKSGQKRVQERFNLREVGSAMHERLKTIERGL